MQAFALIGRQSAESIRGQEGPERDAFEAELGKVIRKTEKTNWIA